MPTRPKDDGEAGGEKTKEKPRDAKSEVPITAYAYDAKGAPEKTVGAYGYGLGLAASGQDTSLGGGVTAWGSPIDRLTIVGDAPRDVSGRFTPSLALIGRLLGGEAAGWALGALGKWKAEGFGVGPHGDEIESEIEGGFLVSFDDSGWHLDTNALAGFGTGPAGEADAEGRLRLGYDVSRLVWLGVDGQARVRLAGPKYLPNGRIWDFAAGPQVSVGTKHFFGAFTAGPATMGLVSDNVGFNAILSAGGAL
ncbi:MAG TPA: hypothetical protein VFV94_19265 [Polyangiaceae bacterium]|nr:hypothetical protein [Polyangiaceae bacterium]